MRSKFEDPISGILLALGGCFGGLGTFQASPGSIPGTAFIIIQTIFIGLFIFRFIRMWMNKEYNPPYTMAAVSEACRGLIMVPCHHRLVE